MLARIPCHPLDTAKARIQMAPTAGSSPAYRGLADTLTKTARYAPLLRLSPGPPPTL
jgi:hypothetical protein